MSKDINVTDGTVLETLNNKVDLDGGNYIGSGLEDVVEQTHWSKKLTNCLLEVPQNIKLELNNGVLTLKAGSKVIVPNGFEADGVTPKFDYVTVNKDYVDGQWGTVTATNIFEIYNPDPNENRIYPWEHTFSGETAPTGYTHMVWYDTKNNLVKLTGDSGASWASGMALPLSVQNYSNGFVTSINQVFNGMGYIGSTVWVDKGVKGLIPNGRNEDGTLNNIEFVTNGIFTHTKSQTSSYNATLIINSNSINLPDFSAYLYDEQTNINKFNGTKAFDAIVGFVTVSSGTITSFQPKQPFRAVDYQEASGLGMPSSRYIDLTLGASGTKYTAPANGWFFMQSMAKTSGASIEMINQTTQLMSLNRHYNTSDWHIATSMPVKKNDIIKINYGTYSTTYFRFIYAQGEV